MQQNRKGFAQFIVLFALAAISIGAALYANYKLSQSPKFGATVYTTQLSDTINTFRQEVNSATANLNAQLVSVSTTVSGLGTLSAVNSPTPVANGGTGMSTAPTNAQFLAASGTTPTWKTLVASSGITLVNTPTSTIISTPGFDNTANIAFTGNNTHAGTETFNSSTVFNATTTLPATTTLINGLNLYTQITKPVLLLLGSSTPAANASSVTVSNIPTSTYLHIVINDTGDGATAGGLLSLQFNGDAGADYAYRFTGSGVGSQAQTSTTGLWGTGLGGGSSVNNFFTIDIENQSSTGHLGVFSFSGESASANTLPLLITGSSVWATSTRITSVTYSLSNTNIGANSYMEVFGY